MFSSSRDGSVSFPNNMTRVAISSYKNVDYDVNPQCDLRHMKIYYIVHSLLLPVSSQREKTIVKTQEVIII